LWWCYGRRGSWRRRGRRWWRAGGGHGLIVRSRGDRESDSFDILINCFGWRGGCGSEFFVFVFFSNFSSSFFSFFFFFYYFLLFSFVHGVA